MNPVDTGKHHDESNYQLIKMHELSGIDQRSCAFRQKGFANGTASPDRLLSKRYTAQTQLTNISKWL
jgi:hypothetical protein